MTPKLHNFLENEAWLVRLPTVQFIQVILRLRIHKVCD